MLNIEIGAHKMFSLAGKEILLTGATGYLGQAMALALAEAGAKVLINSRSAERCALLVNDLCQRGLAAEAAVFDVTDRAAIDAFFLERHDRPLHGLVNNAYVGGVGGLSLSEPEAYSRSYEVSVVAAHNLLRAAMHGLRMAVKISGDASIVNVASMYGMVSPDPRIYETRQSANPPFYGAAKAALLQWTRYAACELGHEGIRVNAISPGPFPAMTVQNNNPEFIKKLAEKVPLGRVGQAHEVMGPVVFLTSSASTFVNGSNIVVDGGWTSW